ncbi:MAG: hypothetical protein ACRC2J_12320 [Microcoleaceae cyanobacterium]
MLQKLITISLPLILLTASATATATNTINPSQQPATISDKLQAKVYTLNPSKPTQIYNAINRAKAGDYIILQKGTYKLPKTIEISEKENLTIIGEDGTKILLDDLDSAVFWVSNSQNINFVNISARHRTPPDINQVCTGAVITLVDSQNINIKDSELDGSGVIGVTIIRSNNILIANSFIHDNTEAGLEIIEDMANTVNNIIVSNSRLVNNPQIIKTNLSSTAIAQKVKFLNNTCQATNPSAQKFPGCG